MGAITLSRVEVWSCGLVWFVGVSYAMYSTYLASQKFCSSNPSSCNLVPGLWFMDRQVDRGYDWHTWTHFVKFTIAPWWLVHLIGAEITRKHWHQYLPVWYILIGSVFHTTVFGLASTIYVFVFCSAFLCLHVFKSKLVVWIVAFPSMHYSFHLIRFWSQWFGWPKYHNINIKGAMMGWTNLRCIAFCSDHIDSKKDRLTRQDIINYFAYIFYLPVMYGGPMVNYDTFLNGMALPYKSWTPTRFVVSCLSILRYVWWLFITDVAFHFTYFASMQKSIQTVLELDNWALYGLVWSIGFYFMMVYVISYGLSQAVAGIEQMPVATHPSCVGRISLYSNMWRYFDRGLYLYMVKYIYVPCLGNRKGFHWRLMASTATFLFIYVYHGVLDYVLVWTVINYLEVTLEGIGKAISSTTAYQKIESRLLSPQNALRFYAMLAAPLMAVSALSNMYFIGNSCPLGDAFTTRLLNDGWRVQLIVFGFCFCASQANMHYQCHVDSKRCKAKSK